MRATFIEKTMAIWFLMAINTEPEDKNRTHYFFSMNIMLFLLSPTTLNDKIYVITNTKNVKK